DGALLHCFEHGRLSFGCGAIDFVSQADLREEWPFLELKAPPAIGVFDDEIRSENVCRHQIGSKLNAGKPQIESLGEGPHEQCFPQTGNAFQQAVAAHEETGEYAMHNFLMA